jgi:hypothetical protein
MHLIFLFTADDGEVLKFEHYIADMAHTLYGLAAKFGALAENATLGRTRCLEP